MDGAVTNRISKDRHQGESRRVPVPSNGLAFEDLRRELREQLEAVSCRPEDEQRGLMVELGLVASGLPEPWGRSASLVERVVIEEELDRAGLKLPRLGVGEWALAAISAYGTDEQRHRWIGSTLRGDVQWCQMFSEPDAGSDLAALSTRAERTDGGWTLTGQKIWTSHSAEADFGLCLARTSIGAPRHAGITCFVIEMRTPGLTVSPMRDMTGADGFSQIFLDDVFVSASNVVGGVGDGWRVTRTTLNTERRSIAGGAASANQTADDLIGLARRLSPAELSRSLDVVSGLVAEARVCAMLEERAAAQALAGAEFGASASVAKLISAEHQQRLEEVGLNLLGQEGLLDACAEAGTWAHGFLLSRCLTIAGGTSEIQRNVIAERILGLPRDPSV